VQRCHNELTSKASDLLDKTLQTFAIEFRSRVVQQQRRRDLCDLLQQPQLRDRHGSGHELLLASGEYLARRTSMESHGDIGAMRACVRELAQFIPRSGC
jgi:hypothetical protein